MFGPIKIPGHVADAFAKAAASVLDGMIEIGGAEVALSVPFTFTVSQIGTAMRITVDPNPSKGMSLIRHIDIWRDGTGQVVAKVRFVPGECEVDIVRQ